MTSAEIDFKSITIVEIALVVNANTLQCKGQNRKFLCHFFPFACQENSWNFGFRLNLFRSICYNTEANRNLVKLKPVGYQNAVCPSGEGYSGFKVTGMIKDFGGISNFRFQDIFGLENFGRYFSGQLDLSRHFFGYSKQSQDSRQFPRIPAAQFREKIILARKFSVKFWFRDFPGICLKPQGFFWVLIFAPILSSLSLEILSTSPLPSPPRTVYAAMTMLSFFCLFCDRRRSNKNLEIQQVTFQK